MHAYLLHTSAHSLLQPRGCNCHFPIQYIHIPTVFELFEKKINITNFNAYYYDTSSTID